MRKLSMIILTLFFLAPNFTWAIPEPGYEKIPSPDQIRNFKMIKKDGQTLYGIRLDKPEPALNNISTSTGNNSSLGKLENVSGTAEKIEKIPAPWHINFYEKIRRIGNALWGVRKEIKEHLGVENLTEEIKTCLKNALNKKDQAVKSSVSTASNAYIEAVSARNACQLVAIEKTETAEILKAIKECRHNFTQIIKNAREEARKTRQEAWQVYKSEIRACYQDKSIQSEGTNVLLDDGGTDLDL